MKNTKSNFLCEMVLCPYPKGAQQISRETVTLPIFTFILALTALGDFLEQIRLEMFSEI